MAGAAFCLGLRFAGTENEKANDVLDRIFDMFLRNWNGSYFNDCAGKPTLETCLMLVLLASSMVSLKKKQPFKFFSLSSCSVSGECWMWKA